MPLPQRSHSAYEQNRFAKVGLDMLYHTYSYPLTDLFLVESCPVAEGKDAFRNGTNDKQSTTRTGIREDEKQVDRVPVPTTIRRGGLDIDASQER